LNELKTHICMVNLPKPSQYESWVPIPRERTESHVHACRRGMGTSTREVYAVRCTSCINNDPLVEDGFPSGCALRSEDGLQFYSKYTYSLSETSSQPKHGHVRGMQLYSPHTSRSGPVRSLRKILSDGRLLMIVQDMVVR
jgi:hypothetical protein